MPISTAVKQIDPVELTSEGIHCTGENVTRIPYQDSSPIKASHNPIEVKKEKLDSLEMIQNGMRKELDILKNIKRDDSKSVWKCSYCPYNAPSSVVLGSHYQYHLQILTSQCKVKR